MTDLRRTPGRIPARTLNAKAVRRAVLAWPPARLRSPSRLPYWSLMNNQSVHQNFFHILLCAVTLALAWVLLPFFGAIFWGAILAILFQPMQRYLAARFGKRRNLATLTTLAAAILIVIIPLAVVAVTLVQEVGLVYARIKSGDLNFGLYFQHVLHALPVSAQQLLGRFGLDDIVGVQQKLMEGASQISQFAAAQALSIGQNTFQFVVRLSLVFFLLRDGGEIGRRIRRAIPLDPEPKQHLIAKFTTVVRATVKGNIAVAAVQGFLGGLIFWILGINGSLLWGVLMAFLSLLPAVGAAIIWAPAALYFFMTGQIIKGLILVVFCVVVIGLVDNV